MLATESARDVAGHTLGDKLILGPVGEGVIGHTHTVVIVQLGEGHIDGLVRTDLAIGIDLVVISVETVAGLGHGAAVLGVSEALDILPDVILDVGLQGGGLRESQRSGITA